MCPEQHCVQIQVALLGTFEAERRGPVFREVFLDDLFADSSAPGLLGQNRNDTVHLAIDVDRVDDLAAGGLQAPVELVQFVAVYPARRPLEGFRRAAFAERVAAPRLPCGYQVEHLAEEEAAQIGNVGVRLLQIVIQRYDDLALGCAETAVKGCLLALIAGEAQAAARMGLLPERFEKLPEAVRLTVVQKDNLVDIAKRHGNAHDSRYQFGQGLSLIVVWNYEGKVEYIILGMSLLA